MRVDRSVCGSRDCSFSSGPAIDADEASSVGASSHDEAEPASQLHEPPAALVDALEETPDVQKVAEMYRAVLRDMERGEDARPEAPPRAECAPLLSASMDEPPARSQATPQLPRGAQPMYTYQPVEEPAPFAMPRSDGNTEFKQFLEQSALSSRAVRSVERDDDAASEYKAFLQRSANSSPAFPLPAQRDVTPAFPQPFQRDAAFSLPAQGDSWAVPPAPAQRGVCPVPSYTRAAPGLSTGLQPAWNSHDARTPAVPAQPPPPRWHRAPLRSEVTAARDRLLYLDGAAHWRSYAMRSTFKGWCGLRAPQPNSLARGRWGRVRLLADVVAHWRAEAGRRGEQASRVARCWRARRPALLRSAFHHWRVAGIREVRASLCAARDFSQAALQQRVLSRWRGATCLARQRTARVQLLAEMFRVWWLHCCCAAVAHPFRDDGAWVAAVKADGELAALRAAL